MSRLDDGVRPPTFAQWAEQEARLACGEVIPLYRGPGYFIRNASIPDLSEEHCTEIGACWCRPVVSGGLVIHREYRA